MMQQYLSYMVYLFGSFDLILYVRKNTKVIKAAANQCCVDIDESLLTCSCIKTPRSLELLPISGASTSRRKFENIWNGTMAKCC